MCLRRCVFPLAPALRSTDTAATAPADASAGGFLRFVRRLHSGTLATKRTLLLTWAGLPPAGSHQLCLAHSFDHLVGAREQRGRHREAEHTSGFGVDDHLELACLQYRQVRRLGSFEDAAGIDADLVPRIR